AAPQAPSGNDVADLARTIAFCLYGSEFPTDVTSHELRDIINGQPCPPELKELLANHVDGNGKRRPDAGRFVHHYRSAIHADPAMAHFDMDLSMIEIRGGTFWMGARDDDPLALGHERPAHQIRVGEFGIARYPVTQRLFRNIMDVNPSANVDDCCPVHNVDFY